MLECFEFPMVFMYSVSNYEHTMSKVHREVILNFSAKQMYELVNNVDQYPQFIPFCSQAGLLKQYSINEGEYFLDFLYKGVRYRLITKNKSIENKSIHLELVKGPFAMMKGFWIFEKTGLKGSRVVFEIEYQLSFGLGCLLGGVIEKAMTEAVDVFCQRARHLYG